MNPNSTLWHIQNGLKNKNSLDKKLLLEQIQVIFTPEQSSFILIPAFRAAFAKCLSINLEQLLKNMSISCVLVSCGLLSTESSDISDLVDERDVSAMTGLETVLILSTLLYSRIFYYGVSRSITNGMPES